MRRNDRNWKRSLRRRRATENSFGLFQSFGDGVIVQGWNAVALDC